jgi:hypothetical protein
MRFLAVALLVTAGCDKVFSLLEVAPDAPLAADARPIDAPVPPECLADDFDDGELDPATWDLLRDTPPAAIQETGGHLIITLAPNVSRLNGVHSRGRYDLTGAILEVEILDVPTGARAATAMEATLDENNYYMVHVGAKQLLLRLQSADARLDTAVSFDPDAHRFWRLRHEADGNVMHFETSADRQQWTSQVSRGAAVATSELIVYLYAYTYDGGNAAPGGARFDNLRLMTTGCGR